MTELDEVVDLDAVQKCADMVSAFWHRSVDGIRGMCVAVAAAREELGKTEFRLMWQGESDLITRPVPLGYSAGRKLAAVGKNSVLTNGDWEHVPSLPSSWGSWIMLDRLERHDHDRFVGAIEAGEITPQTERQELAKLLAQWQYQGRQESWDAVERPQAGDVRHGDFRQVLADLEPGSVDAIVTDPPYPDEFLPLWSDLAEFAAKVLRPGAPLIAYSGQYRLPEVLGRITEHLDYQWSYCLDLPGTNARFRDRNMIQTWKPVIIATAGRWGPHPWQRDRVTSPAKDQALYEWQQNPDPAAELIDRYVPAGGLVVDPFAGVGSFAVAALRMGRQFIGAELDEERHTTARQRIAEVAQ